MTKYPELYKDDYIDELVNNVYYACAEKDCATCDRNNEIENCICEHDLVLDLWRHWKNLKEETE